MKRTVPQELVALLRQELTSNRVCGQPIIEEEQYPTGKLRVLAIWDAWDGVPMDDRTEVILQAYDSAERSAFRDEIVLVAGYTVAEAHAAGLLPYYIFPAVRKSDPVTLEQCRDVMLKEGASKSPDGTVQLRFMSEADAEACRSRLAAKLPDSDEIWTIVREVGTVEDWAAR